MAKKILIVEDDRMLLTIFQMFVQELGYEVAGATGSGEEALEVVENCPDISCVLMDIQLDGNMDGIATAREMAGRIKAPVILTSGLNDPALVKDAVMENVYGFLTKPLYRQNLGITIEYACAKYALDNGGRRD